MTIGATFPITGSASTPNDIATRNTAGDSGRPARMPGPRFIRASLCGLNLVSTSLPGIASRGPRWSYRSMGFFKDLKNVQKQAKEMTPPEYRGMGGMMRMSRDGMSTMSQTLGDMN